LGFTQRRNGAKITKGLSEAISRSDAAAQRRRSGCSLRLSLEKKGHANGVSIQMLEKIE
jgi:hypothetical protein